MSAETVEGVLPIQKISIEEAKKLYEQIKSADFDFPTFRRDGLNLLRGYNPSQANYYELEQAAFHEMNMDREAFGGILARLFVAKLWLGVVPEDKVIAPETASSYLQGASGVNFDKSFAEFTEAEHKRVEEAIDSYLIEKLGEDATILEAISWLSKDPQTAARSTLFTFVYNHLNGVTQASCQ